jgi:hypothetical protein
MTLLEEMVREALQVGNVDRGTGDVFENLDEVLSMMIIDTQFLWEYRVLIILLKGGLAKGEIGVILAPTGVGKSTLTTKDC